MFLQFKSKYFENMFKNNFNEKINEDNVYTIAEFASFFMVDDLLYSCIEHYRDNILEITSPSDLIKIKLRTFPEFKNATINYLAAKFDILCNYLEIENLKFEFNHIPNNKIPSSSTVGWMVKNDNKISSKTTMYLTDILEYVFHPSSNIKFKDELKKELDNLTKFDDIDEDDFVKILSSKKNNDRYRHYSVIIIIIYFGRKYYCDINNDKLINNLEKILISIDIQDIRSALNLFINVTPIKFNTKLQNILKDRLF